MTNTGPEWLREYMRLVLSLAAAIALAVAMVISVLAVPKPADAATTLVTKSFSNTTLITIPGSGEDGPASPYPSSITASFPIGSTVRDVNVVLRGYTHTWPDDVDVLLVHGERNRTILSDAGGERDVNNITLKLDDEALNGLRNDSQLTGGTFKPSNFDGGDTFSSPAPNPASPNPALSGFDGMGARGVWKLFVQDDNFFDSGSFARGWTIQIRAAVPQ